MAIDKVEFEIAANVESAAKSVQSLEKLAINSVGGISNAFSGLKAVAGAAIAFLAGREVINFFSSSIGAAREADAEIAKLEASLRSIGEYSPETVAAFDEFAGSLERASKFTGEQVIAQVALAKQLGLTDIEAQRMVQAAADLASVTGDSLDSSFDQLARTLTGTAGALAKTIPGVKNFTVEQLKSGDAIDLVADRLKGAASTAVQSFDGAIIQVANSTGEFQETVGKLITQNPVITEAINSLTAGFFDLGGLVDDNKEVLQDFIGNVVKLAVQLIPMLVKALAFTVQAFQGLALITTSVVAGVADLVDTFLSFDSIRLIISSVADYISGFYALVLRGASELIRGLSKIPGAAKVFESLGVNAEEAAEGLKQASSQLKSFKLDDAAFKKASTNIREVKDNALDLGGRLDRVLNAAVKGVDGLANALQTTADRVSNADGKIINTALQAGEAQKAAGQAAVKAAEAAATAKLDQAETVKKADEAIKNSAKDSQEFLDKIFAKQRTNLSTINKERDRDLELLEKYLKEGTVSHEEAEAARAIITEEYAERIFDARKKSNEDAAQMVSSFASGGFQALAGNAVSFFVDTLAPGFGQAAGAIFNVLSQDTEKFAETLDQLFSVEFVGNLANNIVTFIEKLPGLFIKIVEYFADNAQDIIEKLVESLIENTPRIAAAITRIFTSPEFYEKVALGIGNGVVNGLKGVGGEMSEAFKVAVKDTTREVTTIFSNIFANAFANAGSSILDTLKRVFKDLADAFKDLFKIEIPGVTTGGGGGGLGGLVGKVTNTLGGIGKRLGLAQGGIVPEGFPNDNFPANLTSGELVVPRDMVGELGDLIARDKKGDSDNVVAALLTQVIKLLGQPITVSTSAEVNGRALADIILQLNRQNARLSA